MIVITVVVIKVVVVISDGDDIVVVVVVVALVGLKGIACSGCLGGGYGFCKGGICDCCRRPIIKWMLCHGGWWGSSGGGGDSRVFR